MSTKADIFNSNDFNKTTIHVEEWGDKDFYLRSVQCDQLFKIISVKDEQEQMILLAAWSLCDEKGEQLIKTDDDLKQFRKKRWDVILKVAQEAAKVNFLDADSQERLGKLLTTNTSET